jgi:para-aminobenzoate synthetase component I
MTMFNPFRPCPGGGYEPNAEKILVKDLSRAIAVAPPGAPPECREHLREMDRFEWRVADGGDPALLLEAFLADAGLPVTDLRRPAGPHGAGAVCGAAVLVSADAGAALAGVAYRPTPVPAVPDMVAVLYGPGDPAPRPRDGGWRPGAWRLGAWRASWSAAEHAAAVEQVREAIGRGDVYQVNVVGHAAADYLGDPLPALRRVASLPGARYGGVLRGAGWAVACASPETLVEVAGGMARTRPIKGTRPATPVGRDQLLASAKERAEHIMIVDLERNDLARVAVTGSVRVERLYALRRWAGLWQAESEIAATLEPGTGLAALLRAVCPGGSVTGAPKLAALAEIAALEPVGRGPSMAAIGWIGPGGLDLGLTIRTVAVDPERVHVWAGGGITWGSEPAAEIAEAAAKAGPLRAALTG